MKVPTVAVGVEIYDQTKESQQLLLCMQVLQNAGDVSGRLATVLVRENRLVLMIWMLLLVASFLASVLSSVQDVSTLLSYDLAILTLPLICGFFYFSRGLLVTTFYLYARNMGQKEMVQEITENMGFCGEFKETDFGQKRYESLGHRVSLCSEPLKPVLQAFKERLARSKP
eukprot:s621_g34.t1